MKRKKNSWKWTLIALIPVFFIIFPIYYIIVGSFETTAQIFHQPAYLVPPTPHLLNYLRVFSTMGKHFFNSVLIAIGVIILVLLMAPMAAFALSKLKIKLGKIIQFIFIFIQMLPVTATIIPLYLFFRKFGLVNTLLGVIIAISSFTIPFIIIILISYMQSFPTSLIESAEIDGASLLMIYLKIVLPLSLPAIITAIMFAFVQGWNNFIFPLVLIQNNKLYPLSISLYSFVEDFGIAWNYLMAGSVIYSIPCVIMVLIGSKFLISGLTAGALKE